MKQLRNYLIILFANILILIALTNIQDIEYIPKVNNIIKKYLYIFLLFLIIICIISKRISLKYKIWWISLLVLNTIFFFYRSNILYQNFNENIVCVLDNNFISKKQNSFYGLEDLFFIGIYKYDYCIYTKYLIFKKINYSKSSNQDNILIVDNQYLIFCDQVICDTIDIKLYK